MEPTRYPETLEAMVSHLEPYLTTTTPLEEIRAKAQLAIEINQLKRKKHAVILGHNYMEPALFHSVPDFTGDSLELSRIAAQTTAEIVVFCGVHFMAETAKILSPRRKVLLPTEKGGCSLAESITADDVRALKQLYPGAPVVSYVNTSAEVKAESDFCCTSSNGFAVVRHLQQQGHETIIFLPDEFLAGNVAKETGIEIIFPEKSAPLPAFDSPAEKLTKVMVGWKGSCEVHERFTPLDIQKMREEIPDVFVMAHPECRPEVVAASDFSGSTTAMIRKVEQMESGNILLLTECSMMDNIRKQNPGQRMLRTICYRCPHMEEVTLEKTLEALRQERHEIDVPEEICEKAKQSLERMIAIG